MDACTIIARNYFAQARVLARSFLAHHPRGRFSLLVIDGPLEAAAEDFEVLVPAEVGVDERELHRMAMAYDVMELATAVKPSLLRWLLDRGSSDITYFDPDIEIFRPLDDISELAREHSLVLTPHVLDPLPHGTEPGEVTLLLAGMFNLGFIAVGDAARPFLEWWAKRVARAGLVDPSRGQFVDQRWVDFVPALFEHFVLRDPGCNVAYWNLETRRFERVRDSYLVNGRPLRFFHYSGFDPNKPHLLSKFQGPKPSVLLSEEPALARICRDYARTLFHCGYGVHSKVPYRFDTLPNGVPIDRRMRRLYHEELLAAERHGAEEPPDPFAQDRGDAFLDWLREPVHRAPGCAEVSRYLYSLHQERPDLRFHFPDPRWRDGDRFLDWVRTIGRHQERIPPELVPGRSTRRRQEHSDRVLATLAQGVNVAGYFEAELGVGEAARQLMAAVERAGIPFSTFTYSRTPSRQRHAFEQKEPSSAVHDTNIICVNADQLLVFAHDVGPTFFENRYSIGLWWWEISEFPSFLHPAFHMVDEVWVGSEFIAQSVSPHTSKPVLVIPMSVEVERPAPRPRAELGLPEGFVFLFSFDFFSVFERKNPLGLIEAFKRAFEPNEGPTLVLKSINGDQKILERELLRAATADRPDIHLLEEYVSAEDKNALMASCDCYVSLHRSEGFGLTMAEAMAYGRPVIATGYSGNLTFMNDQNSYLVPYTLTAVPEGCDPYPPGAKWAAPNLEAAAELIRHVYARQDDAAAKGQRACEDILQRHSPERTGAFVRQRLEIRTTRGAKATSDEVARLLQHPLERIADYIASEPRRTLTGPSRFGPIGRFYRRLLYLALRPHTHPQRTFEAAVADALGETKNVTDNQTAALDWMKQELVKVQTSNTETLTHLEEDVARLQSRIEEPPTGQAPPLSADTSSNVYPSAPDVEPWSSEYVDAHREFVERELDDPMLLDLFRRGRPLSDGLGKGFDERVVEYPWIASRHLAGRVLDAGSTLNHLHVLQRLRPRMDELDIVTLAPEEESFPHLGVSYMYADLRDLPFKDGVYDRVVCISTLDHVGMDNTCFGAHGLPADDPQQEAIRAIQELGRVLRPDGDLYLTVPVGRGEHFAWVRTLTCEEVDELIQAFKGTTSAVTFFRQDARLGWRRSDRHEVADAYYRDHLSSRPPGEDRVVAAEAVACVHLVRSS